MDKRKNEMRKRGLLKRKGMKKNLFIAFEGIDGSGKSTQVKRLTEKLIAEGHKVYATCEPTDSPIGKMIRDIFNHRICRNHNGICTTVREHK